MIVITVEKKDAKRAIVFLPEKINIANSPDLKDKLQSLFDEGYNEIVVNFSKTHMVDSSCLGKLLMFQKKLKERRGELIIAEVTSSYINKMFNMIQLHKVIKIE